METFNKTLAQVLALQDKLGLRLNMRSGNGFRDLMVQDAGIISTARIVDGSAEATSFDASPAPAAVGGLISWKKGRKKSYDFTDPSGWTGDSLPDGHADKPGSTFITRDGNGNTTASNYKTDQPITAPHGYFARLDGTAYNANNAATFWLPRSTWQIAPASGYKMIIASAKVEVNPGAVIDPAGTVTFQLWTYVDPASGYAPCPPSRSGAILVAPAAGLWTYKSIDDLADLADHWSYSAADRPGESGMGGRLALCYEYMVPTADDTAIEAYADGNYGQFIEIRLAGHLPITGSKHAVAGFMILTVTSLNN